MGEIRISRVNRCFPLGRAFAKPGDKSGQYGLQNGPFCPIYYFYTCKVEVCLHIEHLESNNGVNLENTSTYVTRGDCRDCTSRNLNRSNGIGFSSGRARKPS